MHFYLICFLDFGETFSIFRRMSFDVVRCEADSGNIGGNRSHEFHVV
jgi:prolyl-tRNA synthetase